MKIHFLTGRKQTPEHILKRTKPLIGKKLSIEHRKKLSDRAKETKRTPPYRLGIPHTEETKRKLSMIHLKSGLKPPIMIGKDNPMWKGGITPINAKIRNSNDFKIWHKSILERDNFTCQKTGQRGGKLIVHHINNFADFPELRLAIDNGITLSKESHVLFHKLYGKHNNTKEQLEEFLKN